MIMATSARHREPKQAARHGVDAIVDHVVNIVVEHPAERQKPERGQARRVHSRLDKISGELLLDKAIKRHILVEGANDVVAKCIGERPHPIVAVHEHAIFGVGVAGNVEPMPAPALAVPRRSQQPIDDSGEGVGRFVSNKSGDFFGFGRQSD